jgi:hypothetical protein
MPSDGKSSHDHWSGELKNIKIRLKINILRFGCWHHFDLLYIENGKKHTKSVVIIHKKNFI